MAAAVAALAVLGAVVLILPRGEVATSSPAITGSPALGETSPSPTPSSSPGEGDVKFTCWNGRTADVVEDCGRPTGVAGLSYIYPSLSDQWDRCEYVDYRATTATYDCHFGEGIIRYRYWKDPAESERHYLKKYANADSAEFTLDGERVGTLYRATKRNKKGVLSMTAYWGDGHYSLSVDVKARAQQDELWRTVRFRALADLHGHPSDGTPGEAERA